MCGDPHASGQKPAKKLAGFCFFSRSRTGHRCRAIVNGGQTAYTLSRVYEEQKGSGKNDLLGKEVMLKLVCLSSEGEKKEQFTERISAATNNQSKVLEADRRSNEPEQIQLQQWLFDECGLFYERKKGEFEGKLGGVIRKREVVSKIEIAKTALAFSGSASEAQGRGQNVLFRKSKKGGQGEVKFYDEIFGKTDADSFLRMYFSYRILQHLKDVEKTERSAMRKAGKKSYKLEGALRSGKMAVIAAVGILIGTKKIAKDELESLVGKYADRILLEWPKFERFVRGHRDRKKYFIKDGGGFANYYKQDQVNGDLKSFFSGKKYPGL